jgi:hypothetical protein
MKVAEGALSWEILSAEDPRERERTMQEVEELL